MYKGKARKLPGRPPVGRSGKAFLPDPEPARPECHGMAMSVEDMAKELTIGRNVAYQLVQAPDFPSFTIGRRVLVSRKGLQEWIDAQCEKGLDCSFGNEPPCP